MNSTKALHDLGQSIWLDNITREILDNGTLRRYIEEMSVTGLTSNPTIFDAAIGNTAAYDSSIRQKAQAGLAGEELFVELALEDLRRAADLFRPEFDRTRGVDGWVSIRKILAWLLASTTPRPPSMPRCAFTNRRTGRILYVKIPGTPAGVHRRSRATAIFAGRASASTSRCCSTRTKPVFEHRRSLSTRGIERRIAAGLDPRVSSVASLFVSRWDGAVADKVPPELRNRLGIAIASRTYRAHGELLASKRWRDLEAAGARKQRMLWASTGTKDPKAPPATCTSKPRPHRTPSTPCRRRRCWRSPSAEPPSR